MDKWNISGRKPKRKQKGNHKFDASRLKENKHQPKNIDDYFDEKEMLRIQGLTKCKVCESPYPLFLESCPLCK